MQALREAGEVNYWTDRPQSVRMSFEALGGDCLVCVGCATDAGYDVADGHLPTWYPGSCAVCGEYKSVTERRDYRKKEGAK